MTPHFLAYYVDQISPYALRFHGDFGLRWYGIAYVAGFFFGMWLLKRYSRQGLLRLPEQQVESFIFVIALFGVIIGGRLGFFLLYHRDTLMNHPLAFFKFSEGGMASHGGIIGIVVVSFLYAKVKKLNWRNLGDHLVIAGPIGIFCGRLANFINGELWGKAATVPWAVQFPEELSMLPTSLPPDSTLGALPADSVIRTHIDAILYQTENLPDGSAVYNLNTGADIAAAAHATPGAWDELLQYLTPRHPSQLYQGLLEGLGLFLILFFIRRKYRNLKDGTLTGLFFLGYALARIVGEMWRYPSDGNILGMSAGQFFTLFLIIIGLAFLATASRPKVRE